MITDAILNIFLTPIEYVLGLFPAFTALPTALVTSLDYIANLTRQLGDILPTSTMWTIIQLTVAIELSIATFHLIAWLIHWKQAK